MKLLTSLAKSINKIPHDEAQLPQRTSQSQKTQLDMSVYKSARNIVLKLLRAAIAKPMDSRNTIRFRIVLNISSSTMFQQNICATS